ncbi:hypothetical protein [Paenibacillus whitsoniae]|uniref:hypothetical protein n=1 Tax=Paenibacillus whitsoniae TaxID=2496558 RepID=UPI0013DE88E8|nr:hypothetical protein [Paenibacillus whitsoniae]
MNRPDQLCVACTQLMLEEAQVVKAYMRMNPNATVMEVYHQTGVSLQTIKTFMQE